MRRPQVYCWKLNYSRLCAGSRQDAVNKQATTNNITPPWRESLTVKERNQKMNKEGRRKLLSERIWPAWILASAKKRRKTQVCRSETAVGGTLGFVAAQCVFYATIVSIQTSGLLRWDLVRATLLASRCAECV